MDADAPRRSSPPDGAPPSQEVAANVGALVGEQVRRLIESAEQSAEKLHRQAVEDVSSDHEAVRHTAMLVQDRIDVIEASVAQLLRQLRDEVRQIADDAGSASRSPPQPAITGHAARLPADEPPAAVRDEVPPVDRPAEPPAEGTEGTENTEDAADTESTEDAEEAEDAEDDATAPAEDVAADAPPAAEEPSPALHPAPGGQRRGGLFRRLQRREPTLGCAVCGRTPEVGANSREIKRWHATGDVTLCPECQAEGWR
jgi:hypothetical protein